MTILGGGLRLSIHDHHTGVADLATTCIRRDLDLSNIKNPIRIRRQAFLVVVETRWETHDTDLFFYYSKVLVATDLYFHTCTATTKYPSLRAKGEYLQPVDSFSPLFHTS